MSKFAESFLDVTVIEDPKEDDETASGEDSTGGMKVDESKVGRSLSNMPWFLYPPANN